MAEGTTAVTPPPSVIIRASTAASSRSPPLGVDHPQEAEDLQVEPDQGDDQAERPVPLHRLRGTGRGPLLDHVEVEEEVDPPEPDHEHAKTDANPAGRERHVHPEEAEDKHPKVDEAERPGRRDDASTELV